MKRTNNGILIPDVPIMGGLPNVVKGHPSSGGGPNWRKMGGYLESYIQDGLPYLDLQLPIKEFIAEIEFAVLSNISNGFVFGATGTMILQNNATIVGYLGGGNSMYPISSITIGDRMKVTFEIINGASRLKINDVVASTSSTSLSSLASLYLFYQYPYGRSNIRLWSLQIMDVQGNLLRDAWPAYTEENQAALYDYVSKDFYTNAGTGHIKCSYLQ